MHFRRIYLSSPVCLAPFVPECRFRARNAAAEPLMRGRRGLPLSEGGGPDGAAGAFTLGGVTGRVAGRIRWRHCPAGGCLGPVVSAASGAPRGTRRSDGRRRSRFRVAAGPVIRRRCAGARPRPASGACRRCLRSRDVRAARWRGRAAPRCRGSCRRHTA